MFIRVPDPELVSIAEVMKDPAGPEEMAGWVGNGFRKWGKTQPFCSGNGVGIHNVLLIQNVFIQRREKTSVLSVSDGPGDGAFVVLPAFRGLHGGKRSARKEDGVAKHEIH